MIRPWCKFVAVALGAVVGRDVAAASGPRIRVDGEEFHFGVIDVNATGRHTFVVTSAGDQPLLLTRGKITCGCCTCICTARLPEPATIAPGRSDQVTLEWVSKVYTGPFRASVTLGTNDPKRPEVTLWVSGRLGAPVRAAPAEVVLTFVPPNASAAGTVRVYAYSKEPLRVTGWRWSDPAAARHFDVAVEPLTDGQLREEADALGGYQVRVATKPGLPAGSFSHRLVLKTNARSVPTVTIPVRGLVGTDVSLVGPGWDAASGVLSLGTVRGDHQGHWPMFLVVRGPLADRVTAKLVRVSPEWLGVEVGEGTPLSEGTVRRIPLTIRIHPAAGAVGSLGPDPASLGRIVLETSHPDVPRINILVRLIVEK